MDEDLDSPKERMINEPVQRAVQEQATQQGAIAQAVSDPLQRAQEDDANIMQDAAMVVVDPENLFERPLVPHPPKIVPSDN